MKQDRKFDIRDFSIPDEALMDECLGVPHGDELPQVGSEDQMMIGLYQELTHMPHGYVKSYLHHQVDEEITIH